MNTKKRKFLLVPRNKPKSWVFWNLAILTGFFVVIPLVLAGNQFNLGFLTGLGIFLGVLCGITCSCMFAIYYVRRVTGKYRSIEERDWENQVW